MFLKAQFCGLFIAAACLSGCSTVTLASSSNTPLTQGAPFVSNGPLIRVGMSDPTETFDFKGANTKGGRWDVIKEIGAITDETRAAFRAGTYSLGKHDAITELAQISLVVARFFMAFEGDEKGKLAPEVSAAAPIELPKTLGEDARAMLEKNIQALKAPQKDGEDGILSFLTQVRDTLRKMQQAPDEDRSKAPGKAE